MLFTSSVSVNHAHLHGGTPTRVVPGGSDNCDRGPHSPSIPSKAEKEGEQYTMEWSYLRRRRLRKEAGEINWTERNYWRRRVATRAEMEEDRSPEAE